MIQLDTVLGWLNPSVISFNAMSVGTCKLEFTITQNRQPLDLTNFRVMIEVKTPSGAVIEDSVTMINALTGQIEKILTTGMITEKGMHYVELSIYSQDNTKLLVTNKARYSIGVNFGEEGVKATSQYSTLQSLIFDVDAIKQEGIIDLDRVQLLENEANRINAESKATNLEVTAKYDDIMVKHSEVTQYSLQVGANAKRTEDNASQVSIDKGVVTKAKNDVNLKASEVATKTTQVAQDKTIVENAKTIVMENATVAIQQAQIATQKAQEISSSATQINRNKRQIVDTLPTDRLNGQLFFIRKG